jgi:hypothetical protein
MKLEEWWKNLGMGAELDIAGTFIYNSVRHLYSVKAFWNATDTFEILYNLSVGIERLQKVAIVLLEHNASTDISQLEESLKGHSTLALSDRIDKSRAQSLSGIHKEFLSLLSRFYKHHRYGRFSISSVPNINAEQDFFARYICKHLQLEVPKDLFLTPLQNDDRVKRFLGKILKRIIGGLYEIISVRARELNLYTCELREGSKAAKVFMDPRMDFIEEDKVRRELLLFLMHPDSEAEHLALVRSFDPLPLDPGLTPAYAKYLIDDSPENCSYVRGEVDALYEDVKDVRERFELLNVLDNEYLKYDD